MVAPFVAALALVAPPSASDTVSQAQTATVRVPVANVWRTPADAGRIPLDRYAWPTSRVTYAQRLSLVGHLPTQVLYGEQVRVLARAGGWVKVAVPDQPSPLDVRGYPGWVRSWQLGPTMFCPACTRRVTVTTRTAKLSNGTELSFGTQLPLQRDLGDVVQVATPGGVSWLPKAAVRPLPRTRADLVRTAKLFLGLQYLWGGLSAWGMDCSGLTWSVYRAHGMTIPRDADAQYAAGRRIPLAAVKPGDLLFYEPPSIGHVAMALGNGLMIESPNSRSQVRIVPVRTNDFAGARTFL